MTTRFQISFAENEADALARLAYSEMRDPREQVRWIVCQELKRLGLLPDENAPGESDGERAE